MSDLDGDGDLDLVFGNVGQNRLDLNLHRPATAIPFPSVVIPQPAGIASLRAFIPQNSTLVGSTIYAQALWAQGTTVRLSSATADLVMP